MRNQRGGGKMSWLNGHKEVDTTEQLNSKGQTEGKGGKKVMDNVSICTRAATALSALWALSTMQGGRSFSSECFRPWEGVFAPTSGTKGWPLSWSTCTALTKCQRLGGFSQFYRLEVWDQNANVVSIEASLGVVTILPYPHKTSSLCEHGAGLGEHPLESVLLRVLILSYQDTHP